MRVFKRGAFVILTLLLFLYVSPPVSAASGNPVYLTEGCYTFTSGLSNSKCLDVAGNGSDNGTNIQLCSSNDSFAQIFFISRFDSNSAWYSIRNVNSGKALTLGVRAVRGQEINVHLDDWKGTNKQLWRFEAADNGYYYVRSKLGYYLDVWNNRTADGTNVQVFPLNKGNNQKWKLTPSGGIYTFTSGLSPSKRLDVYGAESDNGTNIQLWSSNDSFAQIFYISRIKAEWFSIRNVASQKSIDVAGGIRGNEINVQLYDWNGTDAQLWRFQDAGDGYYYIQNKLGYYLDVWGNQTYDGANVQVFQLNGGNNQKWKLQLADLSVKMNEHILVNLYRDGFTDFNDMDKLYHYYQYFNHGAKYDVKVEDCWNNLFTDIAYPGFYGVVSYNGMVVTPEQLGNIIYGFTGNALGFSDRTIYQGGGYAASGTKYLHDASRYYGDSALDHKFISIGIQMCGKIPTIDEDLSNYPLILNLAKYIL